MLYFLDFYQGFGSTLSILSKRIFLPGTPFDGLRANGSQKEDKKQRPELSDQNWVSSRYRLQCCILLTSFSFIGSNGGFAAPFDKLRPGLIHPTLVLESPFCLAKRLFVPWSSFDRLRTNGFLLDGILLFVI
jgi:hypothetical protein